MSYQDFLSPNFVAPVLSTDLLVQLVADYSLVADLLDLVVDTDSSMDAQHAAYNLLHPDVVVADYMGYYLDVVDMAAARVRPAVAVYTDTDNPVLEVDASMQLVEAVERIVAHLVDSLDIEEPVVDSSHQHSHAEMLVRLDLLNLKLYVESWVELVFHRHVPVDDENVEVRYSFLTPILHWTEYCFLVERVAHQVTVFVVATGSV